MKIEDVLVKKGYSAQEIADMAPLLNNPRFRKDLEDELTTMETTAGKAQKDLDEYDRWFTNDITPEHTKLLKERDQAIADAAAEKARFEAYQRTSMARAAGKTPAEIEAAEKVERERIAAEAAAKGGGFDASKYVDADTFNKAFSQTGTAIAMAADLMEDHRELFGTRLNMTKEVEEAKAARKPVRQHIEEKYKYAARRAEMSAKAEEEKAEKFRLEGYQKAAVEFGSNPNLRMPLPSENPFVIRKKADAGKSPWDKNENELARQRMDKAIQNAVKRGELANA